MKTSNIALALALAHAACGTGDHDDLDDVVWSATAPLGSRAEIDGDGALLFEMGGPDFCAEPPCGPVTFSAKTNMARPATGPTATATSRRSSRSSAKATRSPDG